MKFTKYNNPRKKGKNHKKHGNSYIIQMQEQFYTLLGQAKTEEEKDNIIKAYNITMEK